MSGVVLRGEVVRSRPRVGFVRSSGVSRRGFLIRLLLMVARVRVPGGGTYHGVQVPVVPAQVGVAAARQIQIPVVVGFSF